MGNCLGIQKDSSDSSEDKLFREMLNELRERRVNNIYNGISF